MWSIRLHEGRCIYEGVCKSTLTLHFSHVFDLLEPDACVINLKIARL